MRSGWRLERSITKMSVTKGSGRKEESTSAARNRPKPPRAGKVSFSQVLNCVHPTEGHAPEKCSQLLDAAQNQGRHVMVILASKPPLSQADVSLRHDLESNPMLPGVYRRFFRSCS